MASALATASDGAPAPPRPSRRRLYWFIAAIVAAFAGAFAILLFSDAPPPDVSDLAPAPIHVADADNLFLQVIKTGRQFAASRLFSDAEIAALVPLPAPPISPDESLSSPQKLEEGDGWTPEMIAKRKPEFDAIIHAVRQLQRHTAAQASAPESAADIEDISQIRQFYTRLQLAIWATCHGGDQTQAAELGLAGLRMGKLIRDARGPSFVYSEGTAMIAAFQGTLHRLAAQPAVSADTLTILLRDASAIELMPDGYEHALRSDFSWGASHLAKMDADEAEMDFAAARHFRPFVRTRVLFPLIYKRNATTDLLADAIREEIRLSRKAPKDWPAPKPVPTSGTIRRPWNAYGQTLIALASSSISDNPSREERWLLHTRQKALQTYLALRLFHAETGRLPESLNDLVPRYLPAVPNDDVDGAPLRYSPINRSIWSRGFQDPAGLVVSSADQKVDEKEVFYRLDFAAPLRSPDAANKKAPPEAGPDSVAK